MDKVDEFFEFARTRTLVRIDFGLGRADVGIFAGSRANIFGSYSYALEAWSLYPPKPELKLFDTPEKIGQLKGQWRSKTEEDSWWLRQEDIMIHKGRSTELGMYHPACQQILAQAIVMMMADYAESTDSLERAYYKVTLLRLRSLANKINERLADFGPSPILLYAEAKRSC